MRSTYYTTDYISKDIKYSCIYKYTPLFTTESLIITNIIDSVKEPTYRKHIHRK